MILLGYSNAAKDAEVARYCATHDVARVVILSPEKFRFPCTATNHEVVDWTEIIKYRTYYRLLQEINAKTLVVVNECLRTQNRYDLTYNCMRLFLAQAGHQLVFQYLPQIDTADDFMILFDFDTRSRWKREPFKAELLEHTRIQIERPELRLTRVNIETDAATKAKYAKEKRSLIDNIGLKDPHTIPRNLYLLSGKSKLPYVRDDRHYVGRNNRFGLDRLTTYRETSFPERYDVFEFCHNFIDFADFLALSRQTDLRALVADLKVDQWYFERYQQWLGRIDATYAVLQ